MITFYNPQFAKSNQTSKISDKFLARVAPTQRTPHVARDRMPTRKSLDFSVIRALFEQPVRFLARRDNVIAGRISSRRRSLSM
jgi:hypothetical protein